MPSPKRKNAQHYWESPYIEWASRVPEDWGVLVFHLRVSRQKARIAAVMEALCLFRDLGAAAPLGGPLRRSPGHFLDRPASGNPSGGGGPFAAAWLYDGCRLSSAPLRGRLAGFPRSSAWRRSLHCAGAAEITCWLASMKRIHRRCEKAPRTGAPLLSRTAVARCARSRDTEAMAAH